MKIKTFIVKKTTIKENEKKKIVYHTKSLSKNSS